MNKIDQWSAFKIDSLLKSLFSLNRSLTGDGNRETLDILSDIVAIKIIEYNSGSSVYDWEVPSEWNAKHAWIKDSEGNTLVDFDDNNLHLVSYSEPYHGNIDFSQLKDHLHYSVDYPDSIPYRTSYYKKNWGFCLTEDQYKRIESCSGLFEVYIDSELDEEGSLTVGELVVPGLSPEEILISTYLCHPSLANDNLSGVVLTALLADIMVSSGVKFNKSYRFVWVPETIGAISYCAFNEDAMKSIDTGLVVTTVGGKGRFGYKQSFNEGHYINHLIEQVFYEAGIDYIVYPFDIHGSDERQYSSPGFRINVATITKDKYYEYDHYHNSKDNLDFVTGENIRKSLKLYFDLICKIDQNVTYKNNVMHGEVMLSKHQLYPDLGGANLPGKDDLLNVRKWILFYSDGNTSLLDIANMTGISLLNLSSQAKILHDKGVLELI